MRLLKITALLTALVLFTGCRAVPNQTAAPEASSAPKTTTTAPKTTTTTEAVDESQLTVSPEPVDDGLDQYRTLMIGTWLSDSGAVYTFDQDGSGALQFAADSGAEEWDLLDPIEECWNIAAPTGDYTFILLLHEIGASMAVDYYITVTDENTLSMRLQDGQVFTLTRKV